MKAFSKCFMSLIVFAIFLLPACKKEVTTTNDDSLNSKTKDVSSAENVHRIIVHAGSAIQAAINTADAGSTILIEPGIYKEAIVIDKPGIQIIGLKPGVIIQNPGDEENG